MTDQLESRLRATLGTAATRAPQAPTEFSTEVVSRSRRRRVRRNALVSGICVVAIAAPVALLATRGMGEGGNVASVATSSPTWNSISNMTPVGQRLTIENPAEERPISLWFAKADNGANGFCTEYMSRSGGSTKSCSGAPIDGETATVQGSTESFPLPSRERCCTSAPRGPRCPGSRPCSARADGSPARSRRRRALLRPSGRSPFPRTRR
ncbi:hypothetical protein ACFQYP_37655 [Nonomuraea antimicrobica]